MERIEKGVSIVPSSVDGDIKLKVGLDGTEAKKDAMNLGKSIQQSLSKLNSKNASSSMLGLRNQINKVITDLEKAKAKKEELAKTTIYSDDYKKAEKDYERYGQQLDSLREKERQVVDEMNKMGMTQTVSNPTYARLSKELDILNDKYGKLFDKREQFEAVRKTMGESTEKIQANSQYRKMTAELKLLDEQANQTEQMLAKLDKEIQVPTASTTKYQSLQQELDKVKTSIDEVAGKRAKARALMTDPTQQTTGVNTQAYKDADNQVTTLTGKLEQLTARYREVGEAGHKSGSKQGLGARIAQKAWSGFRGGFKNVIKSFKGFGKEANSTFEDVTKSAKSMFWKILKYGLSIRSLYALIKKLRNTFKESIQVMGMDIPRIRDELNSLINGFQQVKYSLATAFQPIFSYIVPALNTLISALNSAMVALANFFATLTGQKVIYKATKQNKDYAKSISGAGKAAEDANEDIAEYDKLIVINQDKGGGGGGGGGDSGLDSGIFEEAPAKINELAQLIKEAWKKADFTDVGAYIGQKLKTGLESIKWEPIRKTARKVGKSFATLINGFVTVPDLGKRIGSTIAEGINTAWTTVNEFVKNLDWTNVGRFIGDAISSALTTLDFSMLGENLGLGLTGIANTIYGIFSTLNQNLPSILDNINRGIDRFLDTFDPVVIGKAFGEVSTFILDFVDGVLPKLPEIADKLADTFNELIKNLDAEKLARTISNFIKTAINTATTFIKKVDFKKLAEKIVDFLKNLDIIGIVKDLANLLWEVVKAAFEALPGLIKEAPLESALIGAFALMKFSKWGTNLATTLGSTASTSLLGGALKTKISGVFTKIFGWAGWAGAAIIAAIGGWKIGNAFYNWLQKDLSGDNAIDDAVDFILGGDPRKVMQDATAGLDFKSLIYEQLQNPYYQARQEVEKLGLSGQEAYNYLATELDKIDVEGFIEANKTGVSEVDDAAKDLLQTWKDEQLASAEAKYGLEEVKKTYEGIPTSAVEAMEQANKGVTTSIDDLKTQAEEVSKSYNGMPSEIQAQLEKSNSALYQSFGGLKTQFEDIRKVLEGTPEEVKGKIEKVQDELSGLFSSTKTKADEVKQTYNGMPSDIQSKIEQTNGVLETSFDTLKDKVDKVKQATDDYKKSTANSGTVTQKATNKSKNSFSKLADKINAISDKTSEYNQNLSDTNDTISKSLDDTSNKAQNVGTSLSRAFTKTRNTLTNLAGEVKTTWYEKIKGTVENMHTELSGGIDNLGKESLQNLSNTLSDDSEILNKAGNLGKNINSAISTPFTGAEGASSLIRKSLLDVAQDSDGAISGNTGFGGLGNKIKEAMSNLFDKAGLLQSYKEAVGELDKVEKDNASGGLKGIAYKVMTYWRNKMFQMKNATINAYTQGKDNISGREKPGSGLHKIANDIAKYWGDKFVLVRKAITNAYDKGLAHYQNGEKGNSGFNKVANSISDAFSKIKTTVTGTGKNDSLGNAIVNNLTSAWKVTVDYINGGKALTDASDAIRRSYSDTADQIKEKFGSAYSSIINMFGNSTIEVQVTDNIQNTLIGTLQRLAANINAVFSNFVTSFNRIVNKLNSSESMFKRFGNAIYELALENYQIPVPGLAQGGVIPPNKEFLAVLGDQKQGMNIETPLQTMIDAFNTALDRRGNNSSNSAPIVLQLNGREIARAVWDEDKKKYKQTGKYSPNYI